MDETGIYPDSYFPKISEFEVKISSKREPLYIYTMEYLVGKIMAAIKHEVEPWYWPRGLTVCTTYLSEKDERIMCVIEFVLLKKSEGKN